ncbi:MAG: hypothetical protein ABR499_10985 [Gemmatimonadaceae bacterium]
MTNTPRAIPSARIAAFIALALAVRAPVAQAQAPTISRDSSARPVFSLGQPPLWEPYTAALAVFGGPDGQTSGTALVGVHRSVLNPVTGLFGISGEGYAAAIGSSEVDGGARLLARARVLALGAGVDWSARSGDVDLLLTYESAIRRGGVVGRGTMLRVDWLPGRDHKVGVGITVPLGRRFAGRTRPRRTAVTLPGDGALEGAPTVSLTSDAEAALATVEEAAALLRAYGNLYSEANEASLLASIRAYEAVAERERREARGLRLPYGHTHDAVARAYAEALARAFGLAAGDTARGQVIALRARVGLLARVLLPYDSLFGQVKKGSSGIRGLTSRAQTAFERWMQDSSTVAAAARPAVLAAHARWLRIVEGVHRELLAQWKDSRLVWLPLQLALTPDQYDEQEEVDGLIARAVGRPFTDRNALTYLRSSDLPLEIARSIYAARDYHVLWMHDFAGQRESGNVDNIAFSMVADAYFPALTEAVKRYDQTGRLPVYIILLDQFFSASRNGRLWMTMLEDPLRADVDLPGAEAEREALLRRQQAELRAAVAGSPRLQREAARSGGDGWLRGIVKVHVSVIFPSDFSFRSHRILPPIPFTPDNVMRDHRKIAFYDLNEADPYRGGLLVMGVGIGEHYASETWEDRGYRLRGPAALEVREAVRRMLRATGFREDDIPGPLRAVESARAAEQRADLGDYVGRVLQVHNDVGFARKESSVARAMLYNLAPPGSVIVVPDPLWLSAEWAAMLAGAAARGCHVVIIAPAYASAPSPQSPLMAMMYDVMLRLLVMRERLAPQLREARGELRVGLFAGQAHVTDVEGRRREVREGLQRAPWIRELIPFDATTLAVLERAATHTEADGRDATSMATDEEPRPPQLHQKTQLVARPGAIAALVRQPGWQDVIARAMRVQSQQTARFADQLGWVTPDVDADATRSADGTLRGYEQALPEAERRNVSFYFTLGTQNQDPRGMVLDGEATIVVSGFPAAAGLVDLYFVMARSTWIGTRAELDRLLPPQGGLMRRIARIIRLAL